MACCCKSNKSCRAASSCLGRCGLPKHRCLDREEVRPGPVPKHMGWLYTARNAPDFQLRCGWRPGHISCPVLKRIEQHHCMKTGECGPCGNPCANRCRSPCRSPCRPSCRPKPCYVVAQKCAPHPCPSSLSCCKRIRPSCAPSRCLTLCPSLSSSCCKPSPGTQPLIRVIRHAGQYSICTKPSNMSNHPSGPYPLKYVLNTDDCDVKDAKFSVEAKFNDYHFDYTSSQDSFVLDFSPPEQRCSKPCTGKSLMCIS